MIRPILIEQSNCNEYLSLLCEEKQLSACMSDCTFMRLTFYSSLRVCVHLCVCLFVYTFVRAYNLCMSHFT